MRHSDNTATSTWRTLLLGGAIGYLMATSFQAGSPAAPARWLHEMEGEAEVESQDDNTLDTTVAVIVLVLIILTIAFEATKEHIEESADRNLKPIIASLFGEMTVLGFLSIFTFCVTRLGFFAQVSVALFGEEEEEELLETFEFVHYMLFFIMVFFVLSVLALVLGAQRMQEVWWTMTVACRDPQYMAKLDDLDQGQLRVYGSWFSFFCHSLSPWKQKDFQENLRLFHGLREEFALERSLEPPFAPHATNRVEEDFDFGRYLTICLGHELAHVVHVQHYTWLFFALLTVVFCGIVMAISDQVLVFAWVWAAAGWIFVVAGSVLDYHVWNVLQRMAPPSPNRDGNGLEGGALLESTLPSWTQVDMEQYVNGRSWIARCLGKHEPTTNRQDSLYWLERKGPKLYVVIFQIQLVFTSAYVSLLALSFIPFVFQNSSVVEICFYVVISLLPAYLLASNYQASAANMTIATSIGIHRRPQVVSQVNREKKAEAIIRAMVTMQKLRHAAQHGFVEPPPNSPVVASAGEMQDVSRAFDALDASGDGRLQNDELTRVLRAVGAYTTEESLHEIIRVLDQNGDGHVAKEEFLAFYQANVMGMEEHDLHSLAHNIFAQFDRDGSGQLTLGEFKDIVDAFNVGFTLDEVGNIVNELDEHDDGLIGEHEFLQLLEKHRHMFEQTELPTLH